MINWASLFLWIHEILLLIISSFISLDIIVIILRGFPREI